MNRFVSCSMMFFLLFFVFILEAKSVYCDKYDVPLPFQLKIPDKSVYCDKFFALLYV